MARRSTLRASDADREHFADRLRHATAEGRLLAEELEDRLGAVFSARTYGELDAVVADLPRRSLEERPRRPRAVSHLRSVPAAALILAIPVAMALVVAAVVIVATLFALWGLLIAVGWLAFGHRRPYRPAVRYRRSVHACGRWRA